MAGAGHYARKSGSGAKPKVVTGGTTVNKPVKPIRNPKPAQSR